MEENQVTVNKSPKKKMNRKILWIIAGAVVIVILIIVVSAMNKAKAASALTYQTQTIAKGELVAVVGGTGTVHSNQSANLIWQTTGRIDKINYQVGDAVAAGETLASLAEDSLPQSMILASGDLVNAQQSLKDLQSSTISLSNAELTLAQAKHDYNFALGNYWQRGQTQGNANLITITQTKLQIIDNNIVDLKEAYDNMAELADNNSKKALALQNLTQAHIDRDNTKKLLDYYEANPDNVDVAILQGKLDVAKANLDQAQRAFDLVKTGVNPNDLAAAQSKVTALRRYRQLQNRRLEQIRSRR
jgi:HlyD family secretion protein